MAEKVAADTKTRVVTYIVSTTVTYNKDEVWQKNVRLIRKILKETIMAYSEMKILKIESKEG